MYSLFQSLPVIQDSPLIVCFRQQLVEPDLRQIEHMAGWLEAKVAEYDGPLPYSEQLGALYRVTQQAWAQMLDGVYSLLDYLEVGDPQLLAQASEWSELGEQTLQQLEEAIKTERDRDCLCDGYIS